MKTFSPKKSEIKRKWYIVDAKGQTLGRMATQIAVKLRGKDKPIFAPHLDCGDHVIVINAKHVHVSGNKIEAKEYIRHTGYPGGIRRTVYKEMQKKNPKKIIFEAIKGMIPRNKLRKEIMDKLKIYPDTEHPHEAQKPEELKSL